MEIRKLAKTFLVIMSFVLFSIGPVPSAAQETETRDVKEKVTDVVKTIKDYSVSQRDEALKKAKAALNELDSRIGTVKSEVNEKLHEMDQSARKKTKIAFGELKKKRKDVGEWYSRLENSANEEWEDIKMGFLKSYQELQDTFDEVRDIKRRFLESYRELQDTFDNEKK